MDDKEKPGTSGGRSILSAAKKRPRVALSATEKQMVANVYKYVYEEAAKDPTELRPKTSECVTKTAEILKIAITTVYKVLKEDKSGVFKQPKKTGPIRSFKEKHSEETFESIRKLVENIIKANNVPATLSNIHKAVLDDPDLPDFSKTTMYLLLKHLRIIPVILPRKGVLLGKRKVSSDVQALHFVKVESEVKNEDPESVEEA